MTRYILAALLAIVSVGAFWPAQAQISTRTVQYQNPAMPLLGTWRSGNFAYTFAANGTYVYVGAMGTPTMQTQISEKGTYAVSGDTLTIQRQDGQITNSQNYRQLLGPQTTVFRFRLGNTQSGLGMELVYPNGSSQIFLLGQD